MNRNMYKLRQLPSFSSLIIEIECNPLYQIQSQVSLIIALAFWSPTNVSDVSQILDASNEEAAPQSTIEALSNP